jgi:catechol 2,3-dioxygenase-like lactoylglutathione lyase family enzyme
MLGDKTVVATIAVKDIEAAQKFYEGILGLTRTEDDDPGGVMYKSGESYLFVYASDYAGTNKATSASWGVGEDIESVVSELEAKGIKFETYDLPGATREGAVHVIGDVKAAWFTDPDGNILNIVNKM